MPAIVYDFAEIATYLRDDRWWPKPEAKQAVPVATDPSVPSGKAKPCPKKKYAPRAKPVTIDDLDDDDGLL